MKGDIFRIKIINLDVCLGKNKFISCFYKPVVCSQVWKPLDPILNPVVNRDLRKTTGSVLITQGMLHEDTLALLLTRIYRKSASLAD